MVGWHHRLNGLEFEHIPGDNEGQGSLTCCSPQGHKELDTTERVNNSKSIGQPLAFEDSGFMKTTLRIKSGEQSA